MRSSIEQFIESEDIDINGDKPASGVSNQAIEQHSAVLYKRAYDRGQARQNCEDSER